LRKSDLRKLIHPHESQPGEFCVSLYLPTHRPAEGARDDAIGFTSLVRQAEGLLGEKGLQPDDVRSLVLPLHELSHNENFWRYQSDGLAVFRRHDLFRVFQFPVAFEPDVRVGRRFFLHPLLAQLNEDARFYILALSQNDALLFEANQYAINELNLPAAWSPGRRSRPDGRRDPELDGPARSGAAPSKVARDAVACDRGLPEDPSHQMVLDFFRRVDRAVVKLLVGSRAPLVLACVGYLAMAYESINSYPTLLRGKIPGSPELWNDDELRARAWQVVAPHFEAQAEQATASYRRALRRGRAASGVDDVLTAARAGKVDTLLLDDSRPKRQADDRSTDAIVMDNQRLTAAEALDLAVAETLAHGGDVYSLPSRSMPRHATPVAAVLREGEAPAEPT
jgi:hypothetical protein